MLPSTLPTVPHTMSAHMSRPAASSPTITASLLKGSMLAARKAEIAMPI